MCGLQEIRIINKHAVYGVDGELELCDGKMPGWKLNNARSDGEVVSIKNEPKYDTGPGLMEVVLIIFNL